MNRDDIIRMAREAGGYEKHEVLYFTIDDLERFANLVAVAENEACIDLVAFYGGPVDLEAAIRARGNT